MVLSNPSIYLSLFLGLPPACSASEVCVKAQVLAQAVLSDIRSTQVITHDTVYFNTTLFYQKSIVLWVSIYLSAFFSTSPFVWVQKKKTTKTTKTSKTSSEFGRFNKYQEVSIYLFQQHVWFSSHNSVFSPLVRSSSVLNTELYLKALSLDQRSLVWSCNHGHEEILQK